MRFEMGGVDHQLLGTATLRGQFGQNTVEDAQPAPSDEAIVDGLVRTITGRSIPPAQPIADHEQDAAQHPPVVDTRNPVRQRKEGRDPPHLQRRQQQQIVQGGTLPATLNHDPAVSSINLIGPDPNANGSAPRYPKRATLRLR